MTDPHIRTTPQPKHPLSSSKIDNSLKNRIDKTVAMRLDRYAAFDEFFNCSEELFRKLADEDRQARYFETIYSFCICPGGAMGGDNRLSVEVFFGNRPFDRGPSRSHLSLVAEHGARLHYIRSDNGSVFCTLTPAQTDNIKSAELLILLEVVSNPRELLKVERLQRHFNLLTAYMAMTSLDGDPSLWQRMRYFRLQWFKRHYVLKRKKSRLKRTRAANEIRRIGRWVLTIGLSGALLFGLQKCWPSPDDSVPAINLAAASAREGSDDIKTALADLRSITRDSTQVQSKDAQQIVERLDGILERISTLGAVEDLGAASAAVSKPGTEVGPVRTQ